jgi:hypothetical protein
VPDAATQRLYDRGGANVEFFLAIQRAPPDGGLWLPEVLGAVWQLLGSTGRRGSNVALAARAGSGNGTYAELACTQSRPRIGACNRRRRTCEDIGHAAATVRLTRDWAETHSLAKARC